MDKKIYMGIGGVLALGIGIGAFSLNSGGSENKLMNKVEDYVLENYGEDYKVGNMYSYVAYTNGDKKDRYYANVYSTKDEDFVFQVKQENTGSKHGVTDNYYLASWAYELKQMLQPSIDVFFPEGVVRVIIDESSSIEGFEGKTLKESLDTLYHSYFNINVFVPSNGGNYDIEYYAKQLFKLKTEFEKRFPSHRLVLTLKILKDDSYFESQEKLKDVGYADLEYYNDDYLWYTQEHASDGKSNFEDFFAVVIQ